MQAPTVESATAVMREIMAIPAKQIPASLLRDARGVAIIPNVVKGGFVVGVRFGRGVMLMRGDDGNWQPPVFISLTGGSVGWQAGLQATDVVLVFKTRKSIDGLLSNKLTLGVDASAAAGPVGRQASAATDLALGAEILSYSRSRGLFAGAALDGSVLQVDQQTGAAYYSQPVSIGPGAPPTSPQTLPRSAVELMNLLAQYSNAPPVAPQVAGTPGDPQQAHLVPADAVVGTPRESTRQHLAQASQQLQRLLDPSWQQYLALPREVFVPGQQTNLPALQASLEHFEAVARDPKYASLSQRTEFSATHNLLKHYIQLMSPTVPTQLTLPSPPPGGN
jgi:lipid-binding SYLF domain-containing protein